MWGKQIYRPRALLLGANVLLPAATIAAGFPWVLMWMAFAAHAIFFYALLIPPCAWLGPLVTRFHTDRREAWLTLDDGPDGEHTIALARALQERGVRATFFVIARQLARHPEAARMLLESGHTMANHTATHPVVAFYLLLPSRLRAEIDDCNRALREAGVAVTRWFRAPLGAKHFLLRSALHQRGMRFICWNLRGHDGVFCHPPTVARRVARQARPGCIILLHEGRRRSNEAILLAVDTLLAQGYTFIIPEDAQLR